MLQSSQGLTGDDIDDSTAEHCIVEARRLVDEVLAWRKASRPNLIPKKNNGRR